MSLSPDEIRQILAALEKSEWDEALITVGDTSIALSRNGASLPVATGMPVAAPPAPAPPPVTPAAPALAPVPAPQPVVEQPPTAVGTAPDGIAVTSPTVGIFWRAPQPGAPPFVEVGSAVEAGDTLCIVEVMKLMNNVTAPVSGVVGAIHVPNSGAVEFGQTLVTIVPAAG